MNLFFDLTIIQILGIIMLKKYSNYYRFRGNAYDTVIYDMQY